MYKFIKSYTIFFLLLSSLVSCGGGSGSDAGGTPTAPTATISPIDSAVIMNTTPIVISFDQSMDTTSLSLSGSMISDGGVWSSTNVADDTFTISPQTTWALGDQTLTFNAQNGDGLELGSLTLTYTIDDTAPTLSVDPVSGSGIQNNTQVVLSFSESMDIDSFVASGSLWDESDQGVWSNTNTLNDTLTLMPTTVWADGMKTITVDANDLAGNVLVTQMYNHLIDSTSLGVSFNPMRGSTLAQSMPVVITYSKSIDINSLTGSGLLWTESNQGVWSSGDKVNDTLTLSPATVWSLQSHNLSLSVTDIFGGGITSTAIYLVGCPVGTVNCNGACTNLNTDANNCGACNTACGAVANTDGVTCAAGSCTISACTNGFDDCNSNYSDGCEVELATNTLNCGSCNAPCNDSVSCTGDSCSDGTCNNTPNDNLCADTTVVGPCSYTYTCSNTGTRTDTVTPGVCDVATGCITGTPFTQTEVCLRNTNGVICAVGVCSNSVCVECTSDSICGPGMVCIFGVCENINL